MWLCDSVAMYVGLLNCCEFSLVFADLNVGFVVCYFAFSIVVR